jgi:ATP-binding cassette subfamily B multidrug efflux pump
MLTKGEREMSNGYLSADEQDDSNLKKNRTDDVKAFLQIVKEAKTYWKSYFLGAVILLTATISLIYSAKVIGEFVESGLLNKDKDLALRLGLTIIFLEFLGIGLQWAGRAILANGASKTILKIRQKLFEHIQLLPMSFYDRQPQGRIVTRVTHDVEGMEDFFVSSLGRLSSAIFFATTSIIAMCVTDLKLGLILISSVIPAIIFIYTTRNAVRKVNRRMTKSSSAANSKLAELISGLEVIRSFGLEDWSKKEYDDVIDEYEGAHLAANSFYGWSRPLISFLCGLPLVGLIGIGGYKVLAGTMGVGLFVTFIRYCERFINPIMMLAREFNVIQQAFTSAERVASFLNHDEEDIVLGKDGTKVKISDSIKGQISFKNVSMAYDGKNFVLNGLNFDIEAGEKIGLVGQTGCGKTTSVSLISRLYDFQKGDILIDDIPIRDYQRDFLRSNIGFISQNVVLIKGSLRENLCFDDRIDDSEILSACEKTGMAKVMLDNGLTLDSHLVEGGENLSTGQRQLLALTRILLRNPSLLIMDEATANIDEQFERIIHDAVEKIMENRTCLIIAHRLNTLKECDRIFVFDQGKLVEQGPHDILMQKQSYFYRLQNSSEQVLLQ